MMYCCYTAKRASCSYTPRARKENPLKSKRMDLLQPEHLLMVKPQKRRRTETNERKVKRQKTGTRPVKTHNSLQEGPRSRESYLEASCSYTPRARKENPLKRKRMDVLHDESESQLMEMPKKWRRTEKEEKNAKRQKTGAGPLKRSNFLQKAAPLSPETQSEASCSYSLRPHKENPLKRKRMDLLREESESQLMEKPKKRRRTETETGRAKRQKKGAHPVKRNYLQKGSSSTETSSEPSCSPNLIPIRDQLYERPDPWADDLPEDFSERYTIGKRLGRGCYAHVYAGVRKSDGGKVAIKYLVKDMVEYFTPPDETRSLPLEVVLMKLVSKPRPSPYVIKLLEWFETPKGFLLILERPRKCITLYKFCKRLQGIMSEDMARIIMWKVVQAAIHCRDSGVLHRDIKEDNILVNPETLELKLIDFGYAYLLKNRPYKAFGGPPIFLPPQWIVEKYIWPEPATVWDLGVLLCTLTCGEKPLYCHTPFFINGLSDACRSLINWCLQRDIRNRPIFEQILQHDWFHDLISSRRKRRRRKM